MITVTEKVAQRLKRELVETCCELGAEFITVISAGNAGKEGFAREIIERCNEYGLGFRLNGGTGNDGKTQFNIRLDNREPGDEIVDAGGIRMFIDPVSAIHLNRYELDCFGDGNGFFLRERPVVETAAWY